MHKPSKNAPCPCGSGRKYKGCCAKDPEARRRIEASLKPAPVFDDAFGGSVMCESDIDALHNSTVALIQAGKLDEAEANCREMELKHLEHLNQLSE